jgi:hypothetical protein
MPNYAAGAVGAIHIVLQGKGGVGKSFVALHLAQYLGLCVAPRSFFIFCSAFPVVTWPLSG